MIRRIRHLLPALRPASRLGVQVLGTRHVMIAICTHFRRFQSDALRDSLPLVESWKEVSRGARDELGPSAGAFPRQSVFVPAGQADDEWMSRMGETCRATGSELELALAGDTKPGVCFREAIERGKDRLAADGWLPRDPDGRVRYGFIHQMASPVSLLPRLPALRETGCYASFQSTSCSEPALKDFENTLCYLRAAEPVNALRPLRRVRSDHEPRKAEPGCLLLVPPPLTRDWNCNTFGLLSHLDSGELGASMPPSRERLQLWLDCQISVAGRPNWIFIALHLDGSQPENARMLFGQPMREFRRTLGEMAADHRALRFHNVTARELVNIIHAAEAGHSGNPSQFRDFRHPAPPAAAAELAGDGDGIFQFAPGAAIGAG